jgi:serine/threonine protein kinase
MSAAPTNVKDLVTLIVRSKLMTADDLRPIISPLKPTGKESEDLEMVRRALVTGKHLTEYQTALVMRGLTEGFFLGFYRVLELIAKGRMAGVYKAVHSSGQVVAIKVLPASKAKDPETLARFKREGRLLTKLDHPNVVRAFHIGESAGKNYLVLEYLDGDTLDEILETSKRLPPLEAVRIINQAMLGLQHIHERGMIHRDLKPGNLMLVNPAGPGTEGCTVKILDIGLGKAVFDEGAKSPVDDPSQLTTDGVLIGTPEYLAPEQARSAKTADIRSDIYSLGCVLYHAIAGQPPFADKSVLNQVMRHATEPPKPLADFVPNVPDGLQNVINWMLAKDPAQRYATPERAGQALNLLLRNTPPPPKPSPPVVPAYSKWLELSPDADTGKPQVATTNIPVGRLETPGRKPEPAKPTESRKTPTAPAPVIPTAAIPVGAVPATAPATTLASFDVELVPVELPTPSRQSRIADRQRGLFELSRRDVIMLVAGGLFVVIAVLAGWGLSKVLGSKPPETTPPPTAPNTTIPPEG